MHLSSLSRLGLTTMLTTSALALSVGNASAAGTVTSASAVCTGNICISVNSATSFDDFSSTAYLKMSVNNTYVSAKYALPISAALRGQILVGDYDKAGQSACNGFIAGFKNELRKLDLIFPSNLIVHLPIKLGSARLSHTYDCKLVLGAAPPPPVVKPPVVKPPVTPPVVKPPVVPPPVVKPPVVTPPTPITSIVTTVREVPLPAGGLNYSITVQAGATARALIITAPTSVLRSLNSLNLNTTDNNRKDAVRNLCDAYSESFIATATANNLSIATSASNDSITLNVRATYGDNIGVVVTGQCYLARTNSGMSSVTVTRSDTNPSPKDPKPLPDPIPVPEPVPTPIFPTTIFEMENSSLAIDSSVSGIIKHDVVVKIRGSDGATTYTDTLPLIAPTSNFSGYNGRTTDGIYTSAMQHLCSEFQESFSSIANRRGLLVSNNAKDKSITITATVAIHDSVNETIVGEIVGRIIVSNQCYVGRAGDTRGVSIIRTGTTIILPQPPPTILLISATAVGTPVLKVSSEQKTCQVIGQKWRCPDTSYLKFGYLMDSVSLQLTRTFTRE